MFMVPFTVVNSAMPRCKRKSGQERKITHIKRGLYKAQKEVWLFDVSYLYITHPKPFRSEALLAFSLQNFHAKE